MISVWVVRRKFSEDCATGRARICLATEARFPRVTFAGNINFDDIPQAVLAQKPSDYFMDPRIRAAPGKLWIPSGSLWDDLDEEAIRATLRDIMAFLDPRIIEEAKTQWLCDHPANRALAARVMAGLSAGL